MLYGDMSINDLLLSEDENLSHSYKEVSIDKDFYKIIPTWIQFELDELERDFFGREWFGEAWNKYREHVTKSKLSEIRAPGYIFASYIVKDESISEEDKVNHDYVWFSNYKIFNNVPKECDSISHHGIKGMKWGVRNEDKNERKVFISGSSKTQTEESEYYRKELPKDVSKYIDELIQDNAKVIVGDAPGIDRQVQDYLNKKGYTNVEVFGPGKKVRYSANSKWKNNPIDASEFEEGSKEWLAKKDKAMEEASTEGLAIVLENGGASATRNNVQRLLDKGKPIKVYELTSLGKDHWSDEYKNDDSEKIDSIKKRRKIAAAVTAATLGTIGGVTLAVLLKKKHSSGKPRKYLDKDGVVTFDFTHSDINGNNELMHFGVKGMKWGVRKYQNEDGSLTEEGKKRYYDEYTSSITRDKIDKLIVEASTEVTPISRKIKRLEEINDQARKNSEILMPLNEKLASGYWDYNDDKYYDDNGDYDWKKAENDWNNDLNRDYEEFIKDPKNLEALENAKKLEDEYNSIESSIVDDLLPKDIVDAYHNLPKDKLLSELTDKEIKVYDTYKRFSGRFLYVTENYDKFYYLHIPFDKGPLPEGQNVSKWYDLQFFD